MVGTADGSSNGAFCKGIITLYFVNMIPVMKMKVIYKFPCCLAIYLTVTWELQT